MNWTELDWMQNKNASPLLFWWGESLHGYLQTSILSRIFHQIVVSSCEQEIVAYKAFFFLCGNATSMLSATNCDIRVRFRRKHPEALMSLLSKSLTRATPYLAAVHLYDQCPSSIPTSKISYVTENRCWLWVKDNCNHLRFACPRQRRHFLVDNYSEI